MTSVLDIPEVGIDAHILVRLVVTVQIAPHPFYTRDKNDIRLNLPVTPVHGIQVKDNDLVARHRAARLAGRAVHDVIERAWLKNFIAGWIASAPRALMAAARAAALSLSARGCGTSWTSGREGRSPLRAAA